MGEGDKDGGTMVENAEQLRPAVAWERQQRKEQKEQWDTWFRLRKMEAEGTRFLGFKFMVQEYFDKPVTWFKETILDPLHDKYRPSFYHRRFSRVPTIDQCKVLDSACIHEATMQYHLDRQVDGNILEILDERLGDCLAQNDYQKGKNYGPCIKFLEEYEEAELNFFIKYGELGDFSSPMDILMKQKHRMIWERRNPEIMAERERVFKEHKRKAALGDYDFAFWKKGFVGQNKEESGFPYAEMGHDEEPWRPHPISKDPKFYKDVKEPGTEAYEWEKKQTNFKERF